MICHGQSAEWARGYQAAYGQFASVRKRRKQNRAKEDQKKKVKARQKLAAEVRAGRVARVPCKVCGETKVQAHHLSYDDPLNVVWLCRAHHAAAHKGERRRS